ncbi:MAG: FtsQ-type POTRA domain-containing protein [Clostridia bacterium]|nr:FtsQ-type POTRA domain-containing protein [Clostridia bacterium]
MDTTRWGEGFRREGQDAVLDTAPQTPYTAPAEEEEESLHDADYPFEEPEAAPELRSQRSDNLYSRSEPFWERIVELPQEGEEYPRDPNYWGHPERISDDRTLYVDSGRIRDKVKRFLGAKATWIAGAVLCVVLLGFFLLYSTTMTITSITVEGASSIPAEEIIAMSQLQPGMGSMFINVGTVKERIERSGVLRCTQVDVQMNRVVLHVKERERVAYIVQNGRLAELDDRGWVLDTHEDLTMPMDGLIHVIGMDVSHCVEGQAVRLRMPSRLTTYTQLLVELRALGGLELIEELDMTSMDSITMKTSDDFIIQLGNEKRIHEKVRAMLILREVVLEKRYYGSRIGGTIVVTDPTSPAYMRPDGK